MESTLSFVWKTHFIFKETEVWESQASAWEVESWTQQVPNWDSHSPQCTTATCQSEPHEVHAALDFTRQPLPGVQLSHFLALIPHKGWIT